MRKLEIESVTKENFEPFGSVIDVNGAERILINQGTTELFHALATMDVADEGGAPILSIFRATARPAPIKIAMMERHPLGSQAFFPLSNHRWLAVVCAGAEPSVKGLRAFSVRGDQGLQYGKNVWHHPLLIMQETQDFLVADREGSGNNLEEVWFPDGAGAFIEY